MRPGDANNDLMVSWTPVDRLASHDPRRRRDGFNQEELLNKF